MARQIRIASLAVFIHMTPCAHGCRIATWRKRGFRRFLSTDTPPLVERFFAWRDKERPCRNGREITDSFRVIGWARNYEHERISEKHRDQLPEALRRLIPERAAWNSEREWIATTITDDAVQDVMAPLFVDESDIDDLEQRSCGEMMNGGDLYELAKILGHSNIKMTERYA